MLIGDGLRSHLGWEPIYCYRHHHDSLVSPAVLGDRRAVLLPTPKFEISEAETTWLGSDVYSDARETMSLAKELGCESIVVDHYGASLDWQKLVIGQCGPLIVIDDYSDRDYAADIVINWCVEELRKEQTEATALSLVGHKYVPIRDEFVTVRKHVVARNPSAVVPRNLLICFGGVDRQTQARVHVGIRRAHFGRHSDFAAQFGKQVGALLVLRALAVHDVFEFGMACHGGSCVNCLFVDKL